MGSAKDKHCISTVFLNTFFSFHSHAKRQWRSDGVISLLALDIGDQSLLALDMPTEFGLQLSHQDFCTKSCQ